MMCRAPWNFHFANARARNSREKNVALTHDPLADLYCTETGEASVAQEKLNA